MLTDDAITSIITVLAGALVCLAAAAIVNYVVARRNEHKHPPKGHFVTVDGVRIHYLEQGKGAPVVLVHGNGTMAEDFEISGVLAKLAVTHRVIAFDRPGYGYTDRPRGQTWDATAQGNLMHSALHALGVGSPIVVGHSWGTLVALAMALDHPADIRALVLMSGYYNPTRRLDVAWMSAPALPIIGTLLRHTIQPLIGWLLSDAVFRQLFAPSSVTPRFKEQFPLGLSLRPSQLQASAAEAAMMVPVAVGLRPRYHTLCMPVVVLAGTGDRIANFARQSARFAEEVPRSSLTAMEGVGHMVHHVVPECVAAAIMQLADRGTTGR